MKFVLVLIATLNGHISVHSIDMETLDACQEAGSSIKQRHATIHQSVDWSCVKRG